MDSIPMETRYERVPFLKRKQNNMTQLGCFSRINNASWLITNKWAIKRILNWREMGMGLKKELFEIGKGMGLRI